MFCYQCEQTARGQGCDRVGVCGKSATSSDLQDLIIYVTQGIAMFAHRAHALGLHDASIDRFVIQCLFRTVTNVNFDDTVLETDVRLAVAVRERSRDLYLQAARQAGQKPEALSGPADWVPVADREGLLAQALAVGLEQDNRKYGSTAAGLRHLVLFGLKGAAAYAAHAQILGVEDEAVYAQFHALLDRLTQTDLNTEVLLAMALEVGKLNHRVMEILDQANTQAYGHPQPTPVRITPKKGKAILVSGHDLKDLEELLKQTQGTGIQVYTHGEMLPAHGYPGLKQYAHLAGNYGGAWQDQQKEFDQFPGAILMTTNCIQKPRETYRARIFTTGLVGWPGVEHIASHDFSPVIQAALAAPGFAHDDEEKTILVGFGHHAVLDQAGEKVLNAIHAGKIKHFYLIGGCDGAKPGRNFYTEFAEQVPRDAVILTLACGKYRFNKLEFGDIDGIPRLLDIGQCNDAYSAIKIAVTLAQALNTEVNRLPLTLVLSWYEQKAVAILLTLLYLGIKNMRLGPSLPAFLTPDVIKVLVDQYGLTPVGHSI